MYGINARTSPQSMSIEQFSTSGMKVRAFKPFPTSFSHINYRTEFSGLACNEAGAIFAILPSGPIVYIYDTAGQLVNIFRKPPQYHKTIQEDVPFSHDLKKVISGFKDIRDKTQTLRIYMLQDNTILVYYFTAGAGKETYGAQIIDASTMSLTNELPIFLPTHLIGVSSGRIYSFRQPDLTENGVLPNPTIIEYRYTER